MEPTYDAHETLIIDASIVDAWENGNASGDGYAVGAETDTPEEAARAEGWTVLARGVEGMVLARTDQGTLALICHANGPWAVTIP